MPDRSNFSAVFEKLKPILQAYESNLEVAANEPDDYSLESHTLEKYRKKLFFGAVQIRKNYVSFHLMPVYMFPDLLDDISPRLKQRMQGKSCFNFTVVDDALFDELAALTRRGVERVRSAQIR